MGTARVTTSTLGAAAGAALRQRPAAARALQRGRRAAFIAQVHASAAYAGATVELDLQPDLLIGRGIRITFEPGSHNVLRLGAGSSICDRVLLMLKGGTIAGGDRIEFRRDVIVNVSGTLRLDGDNNFSWGCIVHCSNDVHLESMAGVAEQATIADSSHFFTDPDTHFWHNVRQGSVHIGRNTWICPKATLARGADVGSYCIVGSGSVVTGPVPDGHLASGVPALVRPLPVPWTSDQRVQEL